MTRAELRARVREVDGHWIWTGAIQERTGYGLVRYPTGADDPITAHRAFFKAFKGPLRASEDAHHTCTLKARSRGEALYLRRCCNPAHLKKLAATVNRAGRRKWVDPDRAFWRDVDGA